MPWHRHRRGAAQPPEESEFLRFEFAGRNQADAFQSGATTPLGRANKAACAGGVGFAVWSLGGKDSGSRDNPRFLYNHRVPEIALGAPNVDNPTGHSAAFSYDGETIIFGHEPGGGLQSRCKATGEPFRWACRTTQACRRVSGRTRARRPRSTTTSCPPNTTTSWCTARYQSGIGVLDFSNRANAREIAFADPAPLTLTAAGGTQDGGDWSSYFYNGVIYQADITRGLYTWDLDERDTERAMKLRHLNPQTQQFTIGAKKDHDRWNDSDKWHDDRWDDRD